jgi:uncharacterized protein YraI
MPLSSLSRLSVVSTAAAAGALFLAGSAAAQSVAPIEALDGSNLLVTTTTTTVTGALGPGMTTPIRPVSLRAGPDSIMPVIGTLRPGMPLRVLATGNYGWMQVESTQGTGWAYGPGYLALANGVPVSDGRAPALEINSP